MDGMGHVSDIMPEHYDVPFLVDRMKGNSDQRELVNRKMGLRRKLEQRGGQGGVIEIGMERPCVGKSSTFSI